jgi:hypothetical protein
MSIVLRAFHEQAIFKTPTEEFTIGVEADSIEEMSRLWQAFAVPIRLSSMFRVAVVFLTPSETPSAPAPPPTKATLTVGANLSPPGPQLFQTATRVTFTNIPPPGTPEDVGVALAPMTFVAGDLITVGGSALDQPSAASVFVAAAGAVLETEVTAWRQAPITSTVLRLALPATYGAPPAATPVPGVYLLSVGSTSPPLRSATIPLMIAARVNNPLAPSALTPDGAGLFTIDGGGFSAPPLTQVVLDSIVLTSTAGAPGDGEFQVNPAGTQIVFRLPTTIAPGRYFVRIRVNGVESPPSFWIDV